MNREQRPIMPTAAITPEAAAERRNYDSAAIGFCAVWGIGIVSALLSFRLAISGALWNWAVPLWAINLALLVGLWQWIWIAPLLAYARRTNRLRLHKGLRRGGISFSLLQLSLCAAAYVLFRHLTFQ